MLQNLLQRRPHVIKCAFNDFGMDITNIIYDDGSYFSFSNDKIASNKNFIRNLTKQFQKHISWKLIVL